MTSFLEKDTSPRTTSLVSTIALLAFLPLFMMGLYQIYTVLQAFGVRANIIVDTKTILEPVNTDFLQAFAQGGEEKVDMIESVIPEVRALRPKIIRIDHIYDSYDVLELNGGNLVFDWTKLDKAVNSILATGAKPMLSLSYMPTAIAKDGNIINPPNNWDDWSYVIQKTIEHYSGRTQKNISGMYYEVWNEPDLAQFGGWKLAGEKNYLTLYRYAASGAQKAQDTVSFSFGGPATTGLYKNWVLSLVQLGSRLDFISWHSYLADPKQYDTDQRNITTWLLPYPNFTLLPKLVTEFGYTGSKHAGYGSMYSAAFTAAVTRQVISGGPTYLFSFQLKDGPNQENNTGWGLLSHDSQGKTKKPRYHVYNFMKDMAGNRLRVTGEGSWVTSFATTKGNSIKLLLVNFHPTNSKSETVPVQFDNLDAGEYSYNERFLLGRNITLSESITDTFLKKEIYMPINSVAIIELIKKESTPSSILPNR